MLNKVGFCHNISFWPHFNYFWAISLQIGSKCVHFQGVSHGQLVVDATVTIGTWTIKL